jgi:hypothetical protein
LKNLIENIDSFIEDFCKKKLDFANAPLPYRSIGEAYKHCTYLQIAKADAQTNT